MIHRPFFLVAVLSALCLASCAQIGLNIDVPNGGTLEDAILVLSADGSPPRDAYKLGDTDLSLPQVRFDYSVAATSTHWWLIGSMDGKVVYSSNAALAGVDLHSVEPYDVAGPLDWDIPANLEAYVTGDAYGLDWWAQTFTNHADHVALGSNPATLWVFDTEGTSIGTITALWPGSE